MININLNNQQELCALLATICKETPITITVNPNKPTITAETPVREWPSEAIRGAERTAAEAHWINLRRRFEQFKKEQSDIQRINYIDNSSMKVDKWFEKLSRKDQYAIMRSPSVSTYAQAREEWYSSDTYFKAFIMNDWYRKPPYAIKEEFLPNI